MGVWFKTVGGRSAAMWHPNWVFAYEYNPEPLGFNIVTKKPNIEADRKKKKKKPNLI